MLRPPVAAMGAFLVVCALTLAGCSLSPKLPLNETDSSSTSIPTTSTTSKTTSTTSSSTTSVSKSTTSTSSKTTTSKPPASTVADKGVPVLTLGDTWNETYTAPGDPILRNNVTWTVYGLERIPLGGSRNYTAVRLIASNGDVTWLQQSDLSVLRMHYNLPNGVVDDIYDAPCQQLRYPAKTGDSYNRTCTGSRTRSQGPGQASRIGFDMHVNYKVAAPVVVTIGNRTLSTLPVIIDRHEGGVGETIGTYYFSTAACRYVRSNSTQDNWETDMVLTSFRCAKGT